MQCVPHSDSDGTYVYTKDLFKLEHTFKGDDY